MTLFEMDLTKRCARCEETLPTDAFYGEKRNRSGLSGWCKRCQKDAAHIQRYGISLDEKESILAAQGGLCPICDTDTSAGVGWSTDHCHVSGKVRGVLCGTCNPALGAFDESPVTLARAAAYLLAHSSTPTVWWCDTPEGRVLDAIVNSNTPTTAQGEATA